MTAAQTALRAAPASRRVLSHLAYETGVALRNGEQLLVSVVLPLLVLAGLTYNQAVPVGEGPRINAVMPGVLALVVMSTSFTGQAIQTGFDRRYGVLRFLGTTPLGRDGLLWGKIGSTLIVQTIVGTALAAVGYALGWRPSPLAVVALIGMTLVGTACWVSLALALAGTVRAEGVLALANLIWVLCLALGAVVIPASSYPAPLAQIAPWLPSGALGEAMRAAAHGPHLALGPIAVLVAWALAGFAVVMMSFRWTSD